MNEFIAALIGWASMLGDFEKPEQVHLEYVPHEFFVERMCDGSPDCPFIGGYFDDEAPYTIYVDDRFEGDRSMYAASFILHEILHLMQWHTGEYVSKDCDDNLKREKQAYYLQDKFLVQNGNPPNLRMVHAVCAKEDG